MIGVPQTLSLALVAIARTSPPKRFPTTWTSPGCHLKHALRIGSLGVVTDGYISRIPQAHSSAGGGGLERTHAPYKIRRRRRSACAVHLASVKECVCCSLEQQSLRHSFDTRNVGRVDRRARDRLRRRLFPGGSRATPRQRCTVVNGGEKIVLADGVTMWVIRWNHSG